MQAPSFAAPAGSLVLCIIRAFQQLQGQIANGSNYTGAL